MTQQNVLLVGPYDPHQGEYTFVSPPLGVWRLAGSLREVGHRVEVFDPNLDDGSPPEVALAELLRARPWNLIGFSMTGMTLRHDLSLVHASRRLSDALLVAGGMEATFRPDLVLDLSPASMVVLGEGEKPLREVTERLGSGGNLEGIPGTAYRDGGGRLVRFPQIALDRDELAKAIFETPYSDMPYRRYWDRLQNSYRVGCLPYKADREARLSEIRSVRFATLNYCPMGCTFCSSTNFLHQAQASTAKLARLTADECAEMVTRICGAYPDVRTIIFQDDIFVFTQDDRIEPLCEGIRAAKRRGEIPEPLEFISTNRIDSMTPARLRAMKAAGFRVLGFGVESFAPDVLEEFNKARIFPFIEPVLTDALALGLTPFLDIILASPRSSMADLVSTLRSAYRWLEAGCEVGMYPYVIPFSGAAMAGDPAHGPYTVVETCKIPGTNVSWPRPVKILPHDAGLRDAVVRIEETFEHLLDALRDDVPHVPSRLRSLLWILSGRVVLEQDSELPPPELIVRALMRRVPMPPPNGSRRLESRLIAASRRSAFA